MKKEQPQKNPAVYAAVLVLIGFLVLGLSGKMLIDTASFLKAAKTASGMVVDYKVEHRSLMLGETIEYYPAVIFTPEASEEVVQFINPEGFEHDKILFISSDTPPEPDLKRGERIDIYYNPAAPQNARIDDFWLIWGEAAEGAAWGLFFILGSVLMVLRDRLGTMRGKKTTEPNQV